MNRHLEQPTPTNIKIATDFVLKKWQERAAERGFSTPEDLSGSCKFSALFFKEVFGGEIQANPNHVFVVRNGIIYDLNQEAADVLKFERDFNEKNKTGWIKNQYGWEDWVSDPHHHSASFARNAEFKESLKSCMPRVKEWAEEFRSVLLPTIIRQVRDSYCNEHSITPGMINNGYCENLADDVITLWQGDNWIQREGSEHWQTLWHDELMSSEVSFDWKLTEKYWNSPKPSDLSEDQDVEFAVHFPSHCWIAAYGRHYDALSPDGVERFYELDGASRCLEDIRDRASTTGCRM